MTDTVTTLKNFVLAETSEPTYFSVTDYTTFMQAMDIAQDGDIITLFKSVTISSAMTIGSDTKHLTFQRDNADANIIFSSNDIQLNNVTFDGKNIKSPLSLVVLTMDTTFTNCNFKNCGDGQNFFSNGSVGGAVRVNGGKVTFDNCTFDTNYALVGGHIAVFGDAVVQVKGCTLKNGGAISNGGAIAIPSQNAVCTIQSSVISNNQAMDYGGGVSNGGTLTVSGSKIYNNTVTNGGADIATKQTGNTTLEDSIEQLTELFKADKIQPIGWVCDYDFVNNIFIPDVDPTQENALLKLNYEIIPDEVPTEVPTEAPTEQPTEVPTDPVTETPTPTEPSTEESTEQPSTVPTETPTEQPTVQPETEPSESPTETTGEGNQVPTTTPTPEPVIPSSPSSSESTVSNNNTTANDTDSSSSTVNNSSVVNNTDSDGSNDSYTTNTTSTTNNYHPTETITPQATVPSVNEVQGGNGGTDKTYYISSSGEISTSVEKPETVEASAPVQVANEKTPNIKIDAKGVDCVIEYNESGGYTISINASGSDAEKTEQKEPISIIDMIQITLLAAIFICLVWNPKRKLARKSS
ncbi:MAG: hypothetical protein PHF63_11745 [Herbinix sp.]|nr:hypothetical protein [Herbinix sp.]